MTKEMWQELRNIGGNLYEIDPVFAEDLCGIIEVLEKEWENSLVKVIMEYESNTFSAKGSGITEEEAKEVADGLLGEWISTMLDGVLISAWLNRIREKGTRSGK